ncbi:phage late control D family protein [Megalodesulfovibrio paquesii]
MSDFSFSKSEGTTPATGSREPFSFSASERADAVPVAAPQQTPEGNPSASSTSSTASTQTSTQWEGARGNSVPPSFPSTSLSRHAVLSLMAQASASKTDLADVSQDVAPYCLSVTYTDNAHGQADDLQLEFEDRDHAWAMGWMPDKGDRLRAAIQCRNWFADGDSLELACGSFTIDQIDLSGPPDVVRVRAVSAAVDTPLRREAKSRAWEHASLKTVAGDLATEHGLALHYEGDECAFVRLDQRQESDLALIKRVAERQGLTVKVCEDRLVIRSAKEADAQPPSLAIARGVTAVSRFQFSTQSSETYGDASCDYWEPEEKALKSAGCAPERAETDKQVGHTLKINTRVESQAEAERVAANELRQANQKEWTGSLDLMGDPRLYAGLVVQVQGWGRFDGAWMVETATHTLNRSAGYTTSISIRKTLNY